MAKIFRTEELSVNGDSIRISAENGNLIFKDANSNVVTSTDIRTQEVSSLAFKDLDLDSDASSLKYLTALTLQMQRLTAMFPACKHSV